LLTTHISPSNQLSCKEKVFMRHSVRYFALLFTFAIAAFTARAQNLGYEGPTGIVITPTAYTSPSPANGLGRPSIGFHFLAGGPVLGDFSTVSVTEGFAKRFEVGMTGELHAAGSHFNDASRQSDLSALYTSDFNIVHGKAIVVEENAGKTKWIPSIAVGGIYRFSDHMNQNLANFFYGDMPSAFEKTTSTDLYVVATKTIPQILPKVPVLFSAGIRGTNSSVWGIGGASPIFQGRGFGALAFVIPGPAKSTFTPAIEVSQQPLHSSLETETETDGNTYTRYQEAMGDIPTSEAYSVRIVPVSKLKLNMDVGVLHIAGVDYVGQQRGRLYDINARARMFFGLSYAF
jgi:hypothetical protein